MNKYICGVDAGFRNTGLSLFKVIVGTDKLKLIDVDVIVTKKDNKKKNVRSSDQDIQDVRFIVTGMDIFLRKNLSYKSSKNDTVMFVCEFPHGGARGARPNRTMGIITGCLATYFCVHKNYTFENVTPNEVKFGATGDKNASKEDVRKYVFKILKKKTKMFDKIKPALLEHVCDSVGAVLYFKKYSDIYKMYVR